MTNRATTILFAILVAALFVGGCSNCCVQPKPGDAAVVLDVKAKPKAGAPAEHFAHVPVYDAAPRPPAKATGEFEHVDYADLGDIVVWLEPTNGAPTPPPSAGRQDAVSVDVGRSHESDRLNVACVGQKISFQNLGKQPVTLYSVSDGNDFELPPIKPHESASVEAKSEGLIEVLDDPSHPPVARIYVAPSPLATRTQSGKKVVFKDVPPGSYQAVAWHPRIPGGTTQLGQLAAGETKRATLQLGVNDLPKVE